MTLLADHPQQIVTAPQFDDQAMTLAEFTALPDDGYRYEYLRGVATVMSPAGGLHGRIATQIIALLWNHLDAGVDGHLFDSSTGFRLPNGDVRSPDISVIRMDRLADEDIPVGFIELPPDLAVEIISPSEGYEDVQQKISEYLNWGVTTVWIVELPTHTVTIHTGAGIIRLHADDTLDGGHAVPGFSCRVDALFAPKRNQNTTAPTQ